MNARRLYATPDAFRVALEERVKASAKALGHLDPTRQRQLLLADRLLARVSLEFGDAVIAKGGIALELRLPQARATQDLDLQLSGKHTDLLDRLQTLARRDLGDRLRFEISIDPEDMRTIEGDGVEYDGYRFRVSALLGERRYGDRFGLDIVLGGPVFGTVEERQGLALMAFAGVEPGRYRLYPRELHIAEKLHAYTMPRPRPNGRVKDLPDFALLAQTGPFVGDEVRAAISRTFANRATHAPPTKLPPPPAQFWITTYERIARLNRLSWPTLVEVFAAAEGFMNPLLTTAKIGRWDPLSWRWDVESAAPQP